MEDVIEVTSSNYGGEIRHQILAVIRNRWPLIAGIVFICSSLGYLACQLLTPLYAASTSVMIDPREPRPAASRADQTALPPTEETLRKNEIAIIRSRNVAEAVIERLSLQEVPELNPAIDPKSTLQRLLDGLMSLVPGQRPPIAGESEEQAREAVYDKFLRRLQTNSTDASRVIEIRFLSEDQKRAMLIANAIADQYIKEKIKLQVLTAQNTRLSLDRDVETLNQEIRAEERLIEQARRSHGLLPSADVKVKNDGLSETNKQLAVAIDERMAAQGRLAEVEKARRFGGTESAAAVLSSPLIQRLQEQATLLGAKIEEMLTTYGELHPNVVRARAEMKDLREKIDAEVAKVVNSYRNAVLTAQAKETLLRQQVELLRTKVGEAEASEVDIRALERETEAHRSLLVQLAARANETKALINAQGPGAWVISRATIPLFPSFPPKLAIVAVTFFVSGTGAIFLALLLEQFDYSVRSMAQIRQLTSARILGAIPMVRRRRRIGPPQPHVLEEQRSLFAEKLRAVWLQIGRSKPVPTRAVLVTSSVAGEGKTSVVASLARILALAGRRVVVVDGDLRNPSVHRALSTERAPGLAEFLSEELALEEVLQTDTESGVVVMAAGRPVHSPSDMLQSPKLPRMWGKLSEHFDVVIIDSPPLLAVSDASIIAQQVDSTILVVRWGETKVTTLLTALQRLTDLEIPIEGIVLSMVNIKKYRLYGYVDSDYFSGNREYYAS